MPVNQVYKATGEKIIDISDSTVTAAGLAEGETAYDASGAKITGTMQGGLEMNVKFTAGNKAIPKYMFYNNHGIGSTNSTYPIEEVVIGDSVKYIKDYAFTNCTSLTSVTIGNGVISIDFQAFANCTSLTSVTIGNNVTRINDYAFDGCTNLTTIAINKPQGSVSGAPWGATNATVIWTG